MGHSGDQQMLVLGDLTRVARHGKEEGISKMIGWDPKTEVAPSSCQRKKERRKVSCWTGFVADGTKELRVKEDDKYLLASTKKIR